MVTPAPAAYKHADGKKIDGRRVLVDVERGRTVKGWRPRRLGGGLGGTRRGGADVNIKHSGRDDASRYDDRAIGSERDRGERRERSRERDRDKDRERRRTRSRERRRRSRSRERERDRERHVRDESSGNTRRRERERDRGAAAAAAAAAAGEDSRSRERSRERKKRSRSKDRKRERERGKGADGEDATEGDGALEGGERVLEEHEGEVTEGVEERRDRDRDRDRDRRRSHRDRDRRRGDRDREHKRERDRDRGDRKEEHHSSLQGDMAAQDDMGNEDQGGAQPHVEEYSQDGMMDQPPAPLADSYGSSENGYKVEASGDEY